MWKTMMVDVWILENWWTDQNVVGFDGWEDTVKLESFTYY